MTLRWTLRGRMISSPPLAGRQHHALHTAGGAAHHQKGVGRAEGVRRQVLRLPDHRDRMAQIVQRLHAVHVHPHALLPQKGGQLGVAPPALVARHVKGHHPHPAELLQRLIDGRPVLVQPGTIVCQRIHSSPGCSKTKNASCAAIHSLREKFPENTPADPGPRADRRVPTD